MTEFSQALMLIYRSDDDGLTWDLVKPSEVPEWLKHPDQIAMLLAGNMAKNKASDIAVPEDKLPWYRGERVEAPTMETRQ